MRNYRLAGRIGVVIFGIVGCILVGWLATFSEIAAVVVALCISAAILKLPVGEW